MTRCCSDSRNRTAPGAWAAITLLAAVWALTAIASVAAETALPPMHHGVVFFCPEQPDEAIRQLETIKRDGFDLLKFASWVWTLPKPGSDLERNAQAVLDWCDRNDMAFYLLPNIQYGSPGEGGGLDDQVLSPEKSLPLLEDWVRVLRGHRSVAGVILGNEVGPSLGSPEQAPALWTQFRQWLAQEHGSPGQVDCRRYARQCFARFYGTLLDKGLRTALGDLLYGSKTSLDPFLHRVCRAMSVTCWDDALAQHPLWRIKCAADTIGKPLFNAELHLYHDTYQFFPSPEQSRYRYFTSALLGEYLTASFAWGQWQKPEIQQVHAATPGILTDLRRLQQPLCRLAQAYQRADLAALVTESNYYRPGIDDEQRHPLALLYAHRSALGRPWRYLLENDLDTMTGGTLVVWSDQLTPAVATTLTELPAAVQILAVGALPTSDEYARPLPAATQRALKARLRVMPLAQLASTLTPAPNLPDEYRSVGTVAYKWWSQERGHFQYAVPYCLLEVRQTATAEGTLVAVVNNTTEPQAAPPPWPAQAKVEELTGARETDGLQRLTLRPLEVRVFAVKPDR